MEHKWVEITEHDSGSYIIEQCSACGAKRRAAQSFITINDNPFGAGRMVTGPWEWKFPEGWLRATALEATDGLCPGGKEGT